jgi:hypothetical protein
MGLGRFQSRQGTVASGAGKLAAVIKVTGTLPVLISMGP